MRDEDSGTRMPTSVDEPPRRPGLMTRLETTKVTIPVLLGFFAILAVFCLAAAAVGQFVHHLHAR